MAKDISNERNAKSRGGTGNFLTHYEYMKQAVEAIKLLCKEGETARERIQRLGFAKLVASSILHSTTGSALASILEEQQCRVNCPADHQTTGFFGACGQFFRQATGTSDIMSLNASIDSAAVALEATHFHTLQSHGSEIYNGELFTLLLDPTILNWEDLVYDRAAIGRRSFGKGCPMLHKPTGVGFRNKN